MHQGSRQQDPPRFARRHFVRATIRQVWHFHLLEGALGAVRISGVTSWFGQIPMLLKNPDSTMSRPVRSRVQMVMRSLDTMPSRERSSNTFQ